jgi:SNF2 family DNA or RNA helicase
MIFIEERQTRKLPGLTSLFVSFNYRKELVDEIKLLDTTIFDKETKEWEVPLTQLSELIDRCCAYDDITLDVMWDDIFEDTVFELMDYKTTPFEYQKDGIQYGLNHDSWLLLDPPGLGKTLQTIYIAQELKERHNIEHCLIICGINTLKTNWKNEIEKHSNLSCRILGQRINRKGRLVVDGIPSRVKQLSEKIDEFFVITNIETIRDDDILKLLRKNKHNKFDMIVVDEIHTTKNPTSTQGSHLLKLTDAKYKIGATGTLMMNNPLDVYVPLKWIGADRSTYTNFKNYYCNYGGIFGNELIGFKNLSVLKNQIESVSLRRSKDILKLPPKNIITEYVDMNEKQSTFYDNIKEGIITQVDKVKMSTANLLAMIARLRQATVLPSMLTTEPILSSKMMRAIDLSHQIVGSGDKVVIFSTFKQPAYEIAEQLSSLGVVCATGDSKDADVERAIYEFQHNDDIKVFVGTWSKCGTGITLTAASYMIFLDTPWTNSSFEQAQDRIYRIGTDKPVFIYNLIANDTIDERVLEIVTDKKYLSDYVIDNDITQQGLESLRKYIEELSQF